MTEASGVISLDEGKHKFRIMYLEYTGLQGLQAQYEGPGIAKQIIPAGAFSSQPPCLLIAKFSENYALQKTPESFAVAGLSVTAKKKVCNINFRESATDTHWAPGLLDHFATEITGFLVIETAGLYTFCIASDDGSALYINSFRVVMNEGLHTSGYEICGSHDLIPGSHEIRVMHFENSGQAALILNYMGPGIPKQVIPASAFSDTGSGTHTIYPLRLAEGTGGECVGATFCANEGDTCVFTGQKTVRYGADGRYVYQTGTGSIECTNGVFGDPSEGTFKHCDICATHRNSANSGRLEVNYNGQWGTVCFDQFTKREGTVACQQLGFGFAIEVSVVPSDQIGGGPIWLDNVVCDGNETALSTCRNSGWGSTSNCQHSQDVMLACGDVRLAGGTMESEGVLQVYHDGKWGTVCDDLFTKVAGDVVCRELGFGSAMFIGHTNSLPAPQFPILRPGDAVIKSDTPIWMDDVTCGQSQELSIKDCSFAGWGVTNCRHVEDIVIRCSGPLWNDGFPNIHQPVRLVNASAGEFSVSYAQLTNKHCYDVRSDLMYETLAEA